MPTLRNLLIYVLAVIVPVTAGIAIHDGSSQASGGSRAGTVLEPLGPPFAGVERLRLVLIGADDREARGRSDTLMVLQINPATRRALLQSIPRDLSVPIPPGEEASEWRHSARRSDDKVNHAYHFGGVSLTRRTVEHLLGITTDGYLKINLQGFVAAVDTLGGVNLDVEDVEGKGRGMNYDCPQDGLVIHLKPGYQHLTGYKAMGYVRYRKSNIPGKGGTDFDRAKRQQKFIKAMIAQKLRVTNFSALVQAGRQIAGCIDTSLSWRELIDLARFMRDLGPGGLKSMTLPGDDERLGGVYYCLLNQDQYQQLATGGEAFLQGSGDGDKDPTRVEVLNGSGVTGAGSRAAEKLRAKGFVVVRVGNAPSAKHQQTTVLYRGELQTEAQRAAEVLGAKSVQSETGVGPAPSGTAQVQITIGKDVAGT